jgi:hypothetical protein
MPVRGHTPLPSAPARGEVALRHGGATSGTLALAGRDRERVGRNHGRQNG